MTKIEVESYDFCEVIRSAGSEEKLSNEALRGFLYQCSLFTTR